MMGIFIGGKVSKFLPNSHRKTAEKCRQTEAKGQVGIYIDPSVPKEIREEFQNSKSVIKITGDIGGCLRDNATHHVLTIRYDSDAGHGIGTYNVTSVKNIHLDLGEGDKGIPTHTHLFGLY